MILVLSLFAVATAAFHEDLEPTFPVFPIQSFKLGKDAVRLESQDKSNPSLAKQVDPTVVKIRPKPFTPSHYDVELRIVLEDDGIFNKHTVPGKVRILGATRENTTEIALDAGYININRSSIRVISETGHLRIERTNHNIWENILLIDLENEIGAGEKLEIVVEYVAPLYQYFSSSGVYVVEYDEGLDKQLVLSKFNSPVNEKFQSCSNAFPCLDDPQFKTTLNLTLIRKKDYRSEANGELVGSYSDPQFDDWMMDKYTWSTEIRSAMLAFILFKDSEFTFAESHFGKDMKPLRIYAPKKYINKPGFQFVANLSSQVFNCYEDLIGTSSYLPKLKWFFVPNLQSEFTNWGIAINQLESEDMKINNDFIEKTVESLALQMLGDWTDPEINQELSKSLKRYLEYVGLECADVKWNNNKYFSVGSTLAQYILNDLQYLELIGESWLKTGAVLRMMETGLTRKSLGRAFKLYLERIRSKNNRNVNMSEFHEMIQAAPGNNVPFDIVTVFSSFIDNDGFPLVRVGRRNNTHFELKQEHFQAGNPQFRHVTGRWYLPVSFTTGTELRQHLVWLTPENNVTYIPVNASELIIVNTDGRGYYRTFYEDSAHIQLIQKQLEFNHSMISSLIRALLISDHMTLADEDYCSYDVALNLSKYLGLGKETDLVVWKTFLERFATETYARFLMHPEFTKLKNFIHPKIDVMLRNPEISLARTSLHDFLLLFSCELQTPYCLQYANEMYSTWLENGSNPLDSILQQDLRSSLQCAIVAVGGTKAFDFLYEKYEQKEEFVQAFACVRDEKLFQDVLQKTLESSPTGFETDFGWTVLQHMVAAPLPKMKGLIFPFLSKNFKRANEVFGSQRISQLVKYMANAWVFITENDKREVEKFLKQNQDQLDDEYGDNLMQLHEAIETIRLNARWMDSHGRDILNSL